MTSTLKKKSVLRVAHVALQLERGGLEKLLVEFARHADRSRFDLRFISLSTRGTLAQEIEACGWPVTALNEPPGLRPAMIAKLRRLFRQWKIDILHTHNIKPLLYANPAARLGGVPLAVHTCHGQHFLSHYPYRLIFNTFCRCSNRVVCVSHDIASLCSGAGIPQKKLRTIWNGIDISRFAYRGPKSDGPVVAVVRLRPEKDVQTLLRATAIAVKKCPSFRVEIAGDGEQATVLRDLVNELNLSQHVRFLGEVNDVPALLARARLLVQSSLTEGTSLAVLEAAALGLPVVVTRVGGNPEIVLNEQTGLLVPTKNPAELAAAMLRVWSDPDLGRRMGLAGRKRVEENFDVIKTIANYEALYQELDHAQCLHHCRH
jgi:glycosyltransferase involved in cell wall biosynthesis